MFNKKSSANEIAENMSKNLILNQLTKMAEQKLKAQEAIEHIAAAELFEDCDMIVEADMTVKLLEKIAGDEPEIKNLTSEKMIKNLKDNGHISEINCAEDDVHEKGCDCSMCMC